jgi:Ca2+-binding RTX toxin-like protein
MFLADDFIVLQNMVIEGGTNGDLLWANAGDDTVRGNWGDDLIDGGLGDDMIQGGVGDDTITLWPGSGFDSVSGDLGSGNMSLTDRVEVDAIQSQIHGADQGGRAPRHERRVDRPHHMHRP